MKNITNVFVVDDDAAVRDSLRMMLKVAGYSIATFCSADEFLVVCNQNTEGCIILDINMPGMDGHQLQEALNQCGPPLPIIFLTGQGSIPLSVRAMKAGAIDFLTKPVDGKILLDRVKDALDQYSRLREQAQVSQSMALRLADLTAREKEVMSLVIAGYTSKEVGQRLGISFRTVENHRACIMHKTGSTNIIELTRLVAIAPPSDDGI